MSHIPTGECERCGYRKRVNKEGLVYRHTRKTAMFGDNVCSGSYIPPMPDSVRVTEDPPDVPHIFDLVTGAGVAPDRQWTEQHFWIVVAAVAVAMVTGFLLLAHFGGS